MSTQPDINDRRVAAFKRGCERAWRSETGATHAFYHLSDSLIAAGLKAADAADVKWCENCQEWHSPDARRRLLDGENARIADDFNANQSPREAE